MGFPITGSRRDSGVTVGPGPTTIRRVASRRGKERRAVVSHTRAHPLKPAVGTHGGPRCRAEGREMFLVVASVQTLVSRGEVEHKERRSETLRSLPCSGPAAPSSIPACGVSAVYGDRRRHLPSSLALLPLRSASLGYERRDFPSDESTVTRQPLPPSPPLPPLMSGSRFNVEK